MNKPRGYFITFEGGEGGGKSTQIQHVSSYLTSHGIEHLITREPGGTNLAEQIRELLVTGSKSKMDAVAEYMLFSAARRDHVQRVIKPSLREGKWILCDRFYDSSYVYQGIVQGVDLEFIENTYKNVVGNSFAPDLTFIFDLDPKVGLARAGSRAHAEDRFESEGMYFHNKVRDGFKKIAEQNKERCVVLDAAQPPEKVFEIIKNNITSRLLSD